MSLVVDHAFITCDRQAPEAEALREFGFVEGSGNTHPGQGTANRRFFFDNFMLELFWVENPAEATSEQTRRTRLWDRWSGRDTGCSRFGIVFCQDRDEPSTAPFPTWSYHPSYLPPGTAIEIAEGTTLEEPELFYLPFLRRGRPSLEPVDHAPPVRRICGLSVSVPHMDNLSVPSQAAQDAGLLSYFESASPVLEVRFESDYPQVIDLAPALPLRFRGVTRE